MRAWHTIYKGFIYMDLTLADFRQPRKISIAYRLGAKMLPVLIRVVVVVACSKGAQGQRLLIQLFRQLLQQQTIQTYYIFDFHLTDCIYLTERYIDTSM